MDVPFIFIHLGTQFFPEYVNIAIDQCKYWNPNSPIYFVSSRCHKDKIRDKSIQHIFLEDIPILPKRKVFINTSTLDSTFRNGFWKYTTERLFVLEDLCTYLNIEEFFHIENDNMIYFNGNSLLETFRKYSNGLMAPALSRKELTFGILYCNNLQVLSKLTEFILSTNSENEMSTSSRFFNTHVDATSYLPSIPIENVDNRFASNGLSDFKGIFDPAQYGQWLGGIDPRNGPSAPFLFSNSEAIVQPNTFKYEIGDDGRYWIISTMVKYPIYLLHIHSKKLEMFYSLSLENTNATR